ncbi:MAG: R3H domain-containing nucleic acid-binding protein [Candidatus Margulisiibacteriota bacterium]|nr:R3H domain-containing nucleic acid-binding protein [Candidatus Margulisiibacteriota bacterium]
MTTEKIIHFEEDIQRLLAIMPKKLHDYLANHRNLNDLYEVVMDIGHPPSVRFDGAHERLTQFNETSQADIDFITSKIGDFNSDNRAGIERTLHRISAIRNRQNRILGLSIRVGRAVIGAIALIEDLITEGKNLLILGPPGVGKTTKLREAARFLSTENDKRVMVIDTSNEIGGEGDIPHPGIGYARRMQVLSPEIQDKVMIEAVENHTPQVIVVDEIGTEMESKAARTIAERGVQLIGTAHGDDFVNVLKNPTLSDLLGGIQSVILGDEEAKMRGTQKTVLERKSHPTFDYIVEIKHRYSVSVYKDVAKVVDLYLRGEEYQPEIRQLDHGEIVKKEEIIHWSDEFDQDIHYSSDALTYIYPFAINTDKLYSAIRDLDVAATLSHTIADADLLLTTQSQVKSNQKVKQLLKGHRIPVHVIKSNSQNYIQEFLREYFQLDQSDEAVHTDVVNEINSICDRVEAEGRAFDAAPRNSFQRRLQHRITSERQLTSLSIGEEPNRRVRVYPQISKVR